MRIFIIFGIVFASVLPQHAWAKVNDIHQKSRFRRAGLRLHSKSVGEGLRQRTRSQRGLPDDGLGDGGMVRKPEKAYAAIAKDKMDALFADMDSRKAEYLMWGGKKLASGVLGFLGLHIPKAMWQAYTNMPTFRTQINTYLNAQTDAEKAAAVTQITASVANIVETGLGSEGLLYWSTFGAGAASGTQIAHAKEE